MKTAVQIGAGNIGRGFLAQVFYESGYRIVFVEINQKLVDALNSRGRYRIILVDNNKNKTVNIDKVSAVSAMNLSTAARTVAQADIISVAVGSLHLKNVVPILAAGFRLRWENGNYEPLNVLICENLIDSSKYLGNLLTEELNEKERVLMRKTVGLVETSIGRMVPGNSGLEGDTLDIRAEPYCRLPADRSGFVGKIPELMYLKPFSPFAFYTQRKLYIHNFGHAAFAYLGFVMGKNYIWEAVEEDGIKQICHHTLNRVARGLSIEHGCCLQEIIRHVDDLLERFRNKALGDTVERVGKDPCRKLGPGDRIIGVYRLLRKYNLDYSAVPLIIAAALHFQSAEDEGALILKDMIQSDGINSVLKKISGLAPEEIRVIGPPVTEYYRLLPVQTHDAVKKVIGLIEEGTK